MINFLGVNYTWLGFTLLILGTAVGALVVSGISRMAYYSHRNHLLLREMQTDIRKLLMLRLRQDKPSSLPTEESSAAGGLSENDK